MFPYHLFCLWFKMYILKALNYCNDARTIRTKVASFLYTIEGDMNKKQAGKWKLSTSFEFMLRLINLWPSSLCQTFQELFAASSVLLRTFVGVFSTLLFSLSHKLNLFFFFFLHHHSASVHHPVCLSSLSRFAHILSSAISSLWQLVDVSDPSFYLQKTCNYHLSLSFLAAFSDVLNMFLFWSFYVSFCCEIDFFKRKM